MIKLIFGTMALRNKFPTKRVSHRSPKLNSRGQFSQYSWYRPTGTSKSNKKNTMEYGPQDQQFDDE